MINTFHTSYNPPPVPPRAGYSRMPPPLLPGNTPLVKFLSVMLLLLMVLTFGGFFYLFQKLNLALPVSEKAAARTGQAPSFRGPVAHMVLQKTQADSNKKLVWNKSHSLLRNVEPSNAGDALIIKNPGIYFIYSHVTFSYKHSSSSLKQAIWSEEPNKKPDEILRSYCSLDPNTPDLCTASLSGVFELKEDQQLYVTVTNTSLLNKDSCIFGLFKLN